LTEARAFADELIDFIHKSPTAFHVVANMVETLQDAGFQTLSLTERWKLERGGKYVVTRNGSALIAFVVGEGDVREEGFRLAAGHTDSPAFRVKPAPEMVTEGAYLRLNTEVYGGPILNTWLDRPLGIAGRVALKSDAALRPAVRLVTLNAAVVIPNQSIHLNRKVNEGLELNKQKDLLPLLATVSEDFEKDGFLVKRLAERLDVDADDIVDFDLFLHDGERGRVVGLNDEFIACTRLDNLAMVHAGLAAFLEAPARAASQVLVCYDNEEVGSRTKQGAGSPWLRVVLERIVTALGGDREDYFRAVAGSFLISADMSHGLHPNVPDKHDPTNRPVVNGGPVIKLSANQRYTTDGTTAAAFRALCAAADVPVQTFVNRSDMRGGSTIGPIASTHLDLPALDVGNPLLAMHSIRELGGVVDHLDMRRALTAFYGA
jgi:aspartyl aminopeptidase